MFRATRFSADKTALEVWPADEPVRLISIFGSQRLDLRRTRLPRERGSVVAFALFGSIEILVPPEVAVVSGDHASILGSVSLPPRLEASPPASTLEIDAISILGSIAVKSRPPQ